MAETMQAQRRPPLAGLPESFGPHLRLEAPPPRTRFVLRAKAPPPQAAGFDLTAPLNRFSQAGGNVAARLGPDEFLLLGPDGEGLAAAISADFAGVFHALVDVGHRQAGLVLAGAGAAETLNAGCPLDLGLRAFPVGAATRTLLGKSDIVLLRRAEDSFHVECGRSFAPYVVAFLRAAAAG